MDSYEDALDADRAMIQASRRSIVEGRKVAAATRVVIEESLRKLREMERNAAGRRVALSASASIQVDPGE